MIIHQKKKPACREVYFSWAGRSGMAYNICEWMVPEVWESKIEKIL
jgi:hypothetical protein